MLHGCLWDVGNKAEQGPLMDAISTLLKFLFFTFTVCYMQIKPCVH